MRQKMLENLDDSVKGQKPKVSANFVVVPVSLSEDKRRQTI